MLCVCVRVLERPRYSVIVYPGCKSGTCSARQENIREEHLHSSNESIIIALKQILIFPSECLDNFPPGWLDAQKFFQKTKTTRSKGKKTLKKHTEDEYIRAKRRNRKLYLYLYIFLWSGEIDTLNSPLYHLLRVELYASQISSPRYLVCEHRQR